MSEVPIRFDNRVVIVTGAGKGLGRAYSHYFAKLGGKVVVNNQVRDPNAVKSADIVVKEIRDAGGIAVPNYDTVENGAGIVQTAIDNFGRVDIIINNAGVISDKTLQNMELKDFESVWGVHMIGTFGVTRAAWPYLIKQKYGRIINTISAAGLYGNFGQSNYSSSKAAIVSFSRALSKEGESYNIKTNLLAPIADTQMTKTVVPPGILELISPELVPPLVGYLCSENCIDNGEIFETGAAWIARVRLERTLGLTLPQQEFNAENISNKFNEAIDYTKTEYPFDVYSTQYKQQQQQQLDSTNTQQTQQQQQEHQYSKLKSYLMFQLMQKFLEFGDGKRLTKDLAAVYIVRIVESVKGQHKPLLSWTIDLKNGQGSAYLGEDKNADVIFTTSDNDFVDMCNGLSDPQLLFIQNRMKIRGNIRKASIFKPDIFPKPTPEVVAHYLKPKL